MRPPKAPKNYKKPFKSTHQWDLLKNRERVPFILPNFVYVQNEWLLSPFTLSPELKHFRCLSTCFSFLSVSQNLSSFIIIQDPKIIRAFPPDHLPRITVHFMGE
jgi:hypothetical protein